MRVIACVNRLNTFLCSSNQDVMEFSIVTGGLICSDKL